MDIFYKKNSLKDLHWLLLARMVAVFGLLLVSVLSAEAQIPLSTMSYKSNLPEDGVGDWDDPDSWLVYDGTGWVAAAISPNREHDVFIIKKNEIRLNGNEEVNNLYLFGAADAGKKLNLQNFDLDIYGSLHSFEMDENDFILFGSAWLGDDWIYPEQGRIVFKGDSRIVVDRNSWSGQNLASRYSVVFDPNPGQELVVNAVFKASSFLIKSGTVRQTVNTEGTPASSTFSFTTDDVFGTGDFGEFRIASGATLISETTREFDQLIRRSDTKPASSFILEEGANLLLLGEEPLIDAVNVVLDGNVYYKGDGASQEFLQSSMADSQSDFLYQNLYFEGLATKNLPEELSVQGDMEYLFGGQVNGLGTELQLTGSMDQELNIPGLELSGLLVDKASGTVNVRHRLTIFDTFSQVAGTVNFHDQDLTLDFGATGNYSYSGGNWLNLGQLHYGNLPSILDATNATFPIFDTVFDAPRHLMLEGNLSSTGQTIEISFTEAPGVTYDPEFSDDGEVVVYHLNSFFQLNGIGADTDQLSAWILAEDLAVQDINHLRIVGAGEQAIGNHVPASLKGGMLWAGRVFDFDEAQSSFLTIGSISELSVLPVEWLDFEATLLGDRVRLTWKSTAESLIDYTISRTNGEKPEFFPIGNIQESRYGITITFEDLSFPEDKPYWYYQVLAKEGQAEASYSPVLRVSNPFYSRQNPKIYPNPYHSGSVQINFGNWNSGDITSMKIWDMKGVNYQSPDFQQNFNPLILEQHLKLLPAGNYLIQLQGSGKAHTFKWQKYNQ
ncbi:T9SS type A sorting domain-containing protein [Cyclobacterium plantarum]|uniref:T9SS type A sorting domain-containing protein n=1 Tax=Cyclobacterium plantarum TaxID=2716263 RepID=A0ABX0H5Z0_9BACT|nr:T9SS type A sorting domain-containing protein [Cyclobacterium plantarum]NHE57054.1 T9SS type A sorting domain-containing protein [Cyclobacterium plantarum]